MRLVFNSLVKPNSAPFIYDRQLAMAMQGFSGGAAFASISFNPKPSLGRFYGRNGCQPDWLRQYASIMVLSTPGSLRHQIKATSTCAEVSPSQKPSLRTAFIYSGRYGICIK